MAEAILYQQRVKPETVNMIEELSDATHRGKGAVIDWSVEKAYKDWKRRIKVTPDTVASVDSLPHPDGAQVVPVVYTEAPND